MNKKPCLIALVCFLYTISGPVWAATQDQTTTPQTKKKRQIEEIVVTAEKIQSTVSDTSLEITAFDDKTIKEFGMQNADDMVNYIPAATRDTYDIRIRGFGRNFRALGGDGDVATYYNGVYSPDFGIAATENGLYNLERVEVLRGPQGTLYGKNAVGGAIDYITKQPTFDWEGELRAQLGEFNTREFYGFVSRPIVRDRLAMHLVATKRLRDGAQPGIWSADVGTSNAGLWYGDPRGDIYRHQNSLRAESIAAYSQGTDTFNDKFALVLGLRYVKDRKGAV